LLIPKKDHVAKEPLVVQGPVSPTPIVVLAVQSPFETSDTSMIDTIVMFLDEVRQPLEAYGILTADGIDRQQRL
jgi:hypothetical protein